MMVVMLQLMLMLPDGVGAQVQSSQMRYTFCGGVGRSRAAARKRRRGASGSDELTRAPRQKSGRTAELHGLLPLCIQLAAGIPVHHERGDHIHKDGVLKRIGLDLERRKRHRPPRTRVLQPAHSARGRARILARPCSRHACNTATPSAEHHVVRKPPACATPASGTRARAPSK